MGDQPAKLDSLLVSEPVARELLGGVGYTTLKGLRETGAVKQVKIGSRVFVVRASLEEFISSQIQAQGAALKTLLRGRTGELANG
jgi:hypothetical protein